MKRISALCAAIALMVAVVITGCQTETKSQTAAKPKDGATNTPTMDDKEKEESKATAKKEDEVTSKKEEEKSDTAEMVSVSLKLPGMT